MLPEMTWKELAEIINKMTPEQQAQPVTARTLTAENCTNATWDAENARIEFTDYHLDADALQFNDSTK